MLHRTRTWLTVTFGIVVIAAASEAPAQSNPRDAKACPCAAHDRLAIVQDQQGFSIARAKPESAPATTATRVSLGASLKLDRALFTRNEAGSTEAINAPRR